MFLNEEFLKLYEELTQLNEANEDMQKFIDKFGNDIFNTFWNKKQLLKNKGISVDITYHAAHTSEEEMQKILDSVSDDNRTATLDTEGKQIPKNTNNYTIVCDTEHWTVYNPKDYIASIHCAKGGRWCTAGGYQVPEGQVKVSQAKQYFNEYTSQGITLYYLVGKCELAGKRFAIVLNPDGSFNIFDNEDKRVYDIDKITYHQEVKIPNIDLETYKGPYDYEYEFGYVVNCVYCSEPISADGALEDPDGDPCCADCFAERSF